MMQAECSPPELSEADFGNSSAANCTSTSLLPKHWTWQVSNINQSVLNWKKKTSASKASTKLESAVDCCRWTASSLSENWKQRCTQWHAAQHHARSSSAPVVVHSPHRSAPTVIWGFSQFPSLPPSNWIRSWIMIEFLPNFILKLLALLQCYTIYTIKRIRDSKTLGILFPTCSCCTIEYSLHLNSKSSSGLYFYVTCYAPNLTLLYHIIKRSTCSWFSLETFLHVSYMEYISFRSTLAAEQFQFVKSLDFSGCPFWSVREQWTSYITGLLYCGHLSWKLIVVSHIYTLIAHHRYPSILWTTRK
jgi:hypothetical protein